MAAIVVMPASGSSFKHAPVAAGSARAKSVVRNRIVAVDVTVQRESQLASRTEPVMQYRQITDDYAVSPQISVDDVALIKEAGFKSVICNRPDDEDPGQPAHDAIEQAVVAAGLEFRWLPVISGQMTQQNVTDQAAALDELPTPVFAYCRSGTRCTNLYAAIQQAKG